MISAEMDKKADARSMKKEAIEELNGFQKKIAAKYNYN